MSTINVLGPVGYNPTGTYDPTRAYEKLDVVYYQGSSYVAINDSIGQLPTNAEYWDCIAAGSLKQFMYNTVADMKADNTLSEGMVAQTVGFYVANDGGGAKYRIVNEDLTPNNATIIELDNGLFARLTYNDNFINPKIFGAYCDGIHDDSDAFEMCIRYANTLSSSNGTYKRTIDIPATIRVTRKISVNFGLIKFRGTSSNNSKIIFDGATSYLEFDNNNTETFNVEFENITFNGNHLNENPLLKFKRFTNIYFNRVEIGEGGENQYNIYFDTCGLIFMDQCTIFGSNNVTNYPGNRNGIYVKTLGNIFNFTNANCWNLNNVFKFEGHVLNVNIENNWIECAKSIIEYECEQNMKYSNLKIINNYFNIHQYLNFTPSTFTFLKFNMANNSNMFNSSIVIDNNLLYLADISQVEGNSLIYFTQIGGSSNSTFDLNFNNNIIFGASWDNYQGYIFYNQDSTFYTGNNIKIKSFTPTNNVDAARITDNKKIIKCGYADRSTALYTFPNGICLDKTSANNKGNIYYASGDFYAGYEGTIKALPKIDGRAVEYATSDTILTTLNTIITVLKNSHIIS